MSTDPIPFYKPSLPPLVEYTRLLEKIWETRMLSNFATFSQQLESRAAAYMGVPYVKAVVSGDIGLIITLKALGLPENSPCYISNFTFNSTINASLWAGLRPVLIDVDRATFNISPERLSRAMKKYDKPGVILATHVFGNPADIDALKTLAKEHDSFLIFDAAHGLGSLYQDRAVGSFGDAEIFSLSGTKLVTSAEGGLVSTNHKWLAEKITYLRAYGFQHDYNSKYIGLNGKISEIHCALGILGLDRIATLLERRHEIVARYKSRLGDRVQWQTVRTVDRSTYKDISIGVGSDRSKVEKHLIEDGIQTKRYFLPLHLMKPFQEFINEDYPASEHLYEQTICVPAYSDLKDEDIDRISNRILQAIGA